MNTKSTNSNFNLSQSFSWLPPLNENATDLGTLLRKKYTTAQMSDDTNKLKKGDIYILNAGCNYGPKALLALAKTKNPIAIVADTADKKIIEEWCYENEKNHTTSRHKTYFISSLRTLAGFLASSFYSNPSKKIKISAVTGTNGKTTVVNAAAKAFATCEGSCASIGTLGLIIYKKTFNGIEEKKVLEFGLTTPSAVFLQRCINHLFTQDINRLIIEASSIGLVQGRLLGCKIRHAILTNISHDHLDFHGSLEELEASKALLFQAPNLETMIFVKSNETSFSTYKNIKKKIDNLNNIFFVSATNENIESDINLKTNHISISETNISFIYKSKLIESFSIPTIGNHNMENAAAVAGLMVTEGKHLSEVITSLKSFATPEGRMNFLVDINSPLVCIDYAHTPDAFKQTLSTLKLLSNKKKGKLLCVFGCGGDKDKIKRSVMGEIAAEFCDWGCITSDNPRSENIKNINRQILLGIKKNLRSKWLLLESRRKGIRETILKANEDDVILIAGKGHENYQIINTRKIFFNDAIEVKSAFQERNKVLGNVKR